ncbi:hypothetical protein [uncultured Aliiroseovarius sp.]|uniref:hypothetical protein n=1 Tax=uncultured Aliiroseovarius sp. TaxID=1658783 RepID=UPI002596E133|nr:hypothetical protein [uncultured Aliiroseovarius sp.]
MSVLNALDDEVAMLDAAGCIVAANAAWEKFRVENGGEPGVNGGAITGQWGGAKVGHLVPRLGA